MSTMRALAVEAWGQDPTLTSVPRPAPPTEESQLQLQILAAGLPNLVRSQAAGTHYSSKGSTLPYVPGVDGVGVSDSGEILYFSSMATGGAFAETINVPKAATFPIKFPSDLSQDDKVKTAIRVAGLFNPAMASWMGLSTRTQNLRDNFTVVINGVTSYSGRFAISNARALGAGKIIGLGRNEDALKKLPLDQFIVVQDPAEKTDFEGQLGDQRIDVILDFVYGGGSTLELFKSLTSNAAKANDLEVQYVQIGSLGGLEMDLPSALLRSKNLIIRGSGPGAWSTTKDLKEQVPHLLEEMVKVVDQFDVTERKLEDVEAAWSDKKSRSVFVM